MTHSKFEILAHESTELGLLCLRRRELLSEPGTFVTEVTLDHEFLMSSYLTTSERALSEIAITMHSSDELDVLVGGLGLGYTAHAALASERIGRCNVVEFLPPVIDWLKQGLIPLAGALNADERFDVTQGDVYARLAGQAVEQYDLILIDVDHSPSDHLAAGNFGFYSAIGLQQAKLHLKEDGILGVWSYAESSPFADALHDVFATVHVVPVTVFNDLVRVEQTDWLFFARD